MKQLIVATANKKKLQEIKEIMADLDYRIISLADLDSVPRIIENGKTFKANAVKKAMTIARATGLLTMGEDSGLCVNALGGKPGVYSARFSGKDKNDEKNNQKVLNLLSGVPLKKRRAHYCCAVALADTNGLVGVVEGKCFGLIAAEPAGNAGFGYDPLFLIPKYNKTFGQLGVQIKHRMSHRFKALEKTRKLLEKYIEKQGCP